MQRFPLIVRGLRQRDRRLRQCGENSDSHILRLELALNNMGQGLLMFDSAARR